MKKTHIIIAVVVGLLALLAIAYYLAQPAAQETIGPDEHTLGNPNAKVVLIEYASPSCIVCSRWNQQIMPQIKAEYIDTGKIYYVYRFFLLSSFPNDPDVAKMALCQPKDKFFEFLDMMYRNQPQWDKAEYPSVSDPDAALVSMGARAGMGPDAVAQCRAPNPAVEQQIDRIAADGEAKYNIDGTPTMVVNGVPVNMDYDSLKAAIDAALKE